MKRKNLEEKFKEKLEDIRKMEQETQAIEEKYKEDIKSFEELEKQIQSIKQNLGKKEKKKKIFN